MAMGQQKDRPRSGSCVLRPPAVGADRGFDAFAGELPALLRGQDGRALGAARALFRMHLVGYFEGIDSERGLEWRCSDSLSLREFLRLGEPCAGPFLAVEDMKSTRRSSTGFWP